MKKLMQAYGPIRPSSVRVIISGKDTKDRLVFEGKLKERWAASVAAGCIEDWDVVFRRAEERRSKKK